MSTATHASSTLKSFQDVSSSSSLTALSRQNQSSTIDSSQSQVVTSGAQTGIGQSNSNQVSAISSRPINYQRSASSQPASRTGSQLSTPHKSVPLKNESPGIWKHPRAEEIARRQRASTFGADNIALILKSISLLAAVEILRRTLPNFIWKLLSPISQLAGDALYMAIWISGLLTIAFACRPLYFGSDQLLDVDLNATQRSLLGLDPNATPPATPATKYVTPPKYARSATPRSGTPASRGSSPGDSPLAYKDTAGYRRSSDSLSSSRRASFGSDPRRQSLGLSVSVFGTPSKEGSVFVPQTPSPIGRGSGIPFSNKWLYHKATTGAMGRDSF